MSAEPGATDKGLRLRAEDVEDIAVISACLQDALVSVRDLAYDRATRTFMFVANRFRWEGRRGKRSGLPFERTLCGIVFDAVDGVAYRGFHRAEGDRILVLLAIRPTPGPTINLDFAAGVTIRLSAAAISCRAHDFGEPWPTGWQPGHALDEAQ